MNNRFKTDVLIIGAGAAGLCAALNLASKLKVSVLCKGTHAGVNKARSGSIVARSGSIVARSGSIVARSGSTPWAQGGIAAVTDPADSEAAHIADTLNAGAGLCNEAIVRHTVENARDAIEQLVTWGMQFDRDEPDNYHLTREGGHSFRRILHVADATGQAISQTLNNQANNHPHIEILENRVCIDLITTAKLGVGDNRCIGAYAFNTVTEQVEVFAANVVILATGGASKVYLYTSNPDSATGDGIAMAWRAGCRIANMEFNQFHPTCLYHPHAKSFLISEAVRGEGGKLALPDGSAFMADFDEREELAPRDIVARAIDHEMKRLGADHLYLDISHRSPDFIASHFPTIQSRCLEFGIDITRQPIPVVPAAHYSCGGVLVDQNGATDLANLYAIGETSCSGLHGANRLASNSLLECLVFGRSSALHILSGWQPAATITELPRWDESRVTDSDENVVLSHNWDELRRFMWDYVGIVRTQKRLDRAHRRIQLLKQEVHDYYANYRVGNDLLELRNLLTVAELMVRSAQSRQESRGLHYNLDFPKESPIARDTILYPDRQDPLDVLQPVID